MAILYRPDLDCYSWDQLYNGLEPELKLGVDRIIWTFKQKLINMHGVDQTAVLDFAFPKDYLKLLYDPLLPNEMEETMSEEERMYALASADSICWVRTFLKFQPRVYQIISMRISLIAVHTMAIPYGNGVPEKGGC